MMVKTFILNFFKNSKVIIFIISLMYVVTIYIHSLISNRNYVAFLDVGEGDATLIHNNYGYILIDGGPNKKVLFELGKFMYPWEREFKLVIATHPHADHITGLQYIQQYYTFEKIIVNKVCFDSKAWSQILNESENCKNEYLYGVQIICMPLGKQEYVCSKSLNGNVNNDGVIVVSNVSRRKFIIMGDAESSVENYLINKKLISSVDILRAGHHCSKTSSSIKFLKEIDPEIAICSVGLYNRFHHPNQIVLDRFKEQNIEIKRTDLDGSVVIK